MKDQTKKDAIEVLQSYSIRLIEKGQELVEANDKLAVSEEEYKLLRAKILNLDRVQNQPNQVLREAEADTIMNNDERFKGKYRGYLTDKLTQRNAWINYEVMKELNSNYRAILNSYTYGKDE